MKKIISILLSLIVVISISSCGNNKKANDLRKIITEVENKLAEETKTEKATTTKATTTKATTTKATTTKATTTKATTTETSTIPPTTESTTTIDVEAKLDAMMQEEADKEFLEVEKYADKLEQAIRNMESPYAVQQDFTDLLNYSFEFQSAYQAYHLLRPGYHELPKGLFEAAGEIAGMSMISDGKGFTDAEAYHIVDLCKEMLLSVFPDRLK